MKYFFTILFFVNLTFALADQPPQIPDQPKPIPKHVSIDPKTLRELVLDENNEILIGLNHIHQAKDRVNIARGNLLPSVNLSMVLQIMSNPTFALSAVEFLLPFLLPSRWFDYYEQKDMLAAEKDGYHALQLNTYASAYSLYYTLLSDQMLFEVLRKENEDLKQVYDVLVQRDIILGNVSQNDILHAKSQYDLSGAKVAKLEGLLIEERSELRKALALNLETEITLVPTAVPASQWEEKTVPETVEQALLVAPESRQLKSLEKAAERARWSKVFAFISGASVGAQSGFNTGNIQSVSFNNVVLRQNVSFGFAYFPAIELSQRQIEEVRLRQRELVIDNRQVLEKVVLGLKHALRRRELAARSEASMKDVYQTANRKYELGMETLLNVLLTRRQVTESSAELVAADTYVNLLRVLLNRTLLLDEFSLVPGCNINAEAVKKASGSAWDWIKNVFSGRNNSVSIDKACRNKTK